MSGGNTTLMRTRCPECATVFRVTSEQLRRKAGTVRCGHCQHVFNAFDHWLAEGGEAPVEHTAPELGSEVHVPSPPVAVNEFEPTQGEAWCEPEPEPEAFDPAATIVVDSDWHPTEELLQTGDLREESAVEDAVEDNAEQQESFTEAPESVSFDAAETLVATPADHFIVSERKDLKDAPHTDDAVETPEQSTQAARNAGLVAARELPESASYNRWAAGTLASDGGGIFDAEKNQGASWPFVLASVLLVIALLIQGLYHYRTDLAVRMPSLAALYQTLSVDVPLPRNPALVSIETSDLQSDNARGLFVLQSTLKNRATYAQAWPALELSLTDTNDAVVARRVLYAAEYLPPGTTSDTFSANGDVAVRLWIEAKGVSASGYRLYIFYP